MRQLNRTWGAAVAVSLAILATSAEAGPPAEPPELDPAAIAALEQMAAYMGTLKTFEVKSATTREEVLDDGQKVQTAGVVRVVAQRPDKLRADVVRDDRDQLYLYDGQSFTLFARRLDYYATVPAPPTIGQLADRLEDEYGLEVPLIDLFTWGSGRWSAADIKAAMVVGPSQVGGTTCEHYAFRQDGLDWQIWLQKGDFPLPRRLVITTLTDEARPQFTAVYTWNLAPSVNDAAFTFDPPPGTHRIVLAENPPAGK